MKKIYFSTILFFFMKSLLFSQHTIKTKNRYKSDTLQGRHFGDFIKPVDGIKFKENENKEAPYFKKCAYLKSTVDRKKCFSDIFYGNLRKKLNFNSELLNNNAIDIVVQFKINTLGKIESIRFLKSNDTTGDMEKEIIRVLKKLPKIIPAKINGNFVATTYKFPIQFKNL